MSGAPALEEQILDVVDDGEEDDAGRADQTGEKTAFEEMDTQAGELVHAPDSIAVLGLVQKESEGKCGFCR